MNTVILTLMVNGLHLYGTFLPDRTKCFTIFYTPSAIHQEYRLHHVFFCWGLQAVVWVVSQFSCFELERSIVPGFFSGFGNYLSSMCKARAATKWARHEPMCTCKHKDSVLIGKRLLLYYSEPYLDTSFTSQYPILLTKNIVVCL